MSRSGTWQRFFSRPRWKLSESMKAWKPGEWLDGHCVRTLQVLTHLCEPCEVEEEGVAKQDPVTARESSRRSGTSTSGNVSVNLMNVIKWSDQLNLGHNYVVSIKSFTKWFAIAVVIIIGCLWKKKKGRQQRLTRSQLQTLSCLHEKEENEPHSHYNHYLMSRGHKGF